MYQMKNKSVINASHNSAVLLPNSAQRKYNTKTGHQSGVFAYQF